MAEYNIQESSGWSLNEFKRVDGRAEMGAAIKAIRFSVGGRENERLLSNTEGGGNRRDTNRLEGEIEPRPFLASLPSYRPPRRILFQGFPATSYNPSRKLFLDSGDIPPLWIRNFETRIGIWRIKKCNKVVVVIVLLLRSKQNDERNDNNKNFLKLFVLWRDVFIDIFEFMDQMVKARQKKDSNVYHHWLNNFLITQQLIIIVQNKLVRMKNIQKIRLYTMTHRSI